MAEAENPFFSLQGRGGAESSPGGVRGTTAPNGLAINGGGGNSFNGDPSISLRGMAAGFDPLKSGAEAIGIMRGITENNILKYNYNAKKATSDALSRNIGPDGSFDSAGFADEANKNPYVAANYAEALKAVQDAHSAQLDAAKKQVEVALQRHTAASNIMQSLLTKRDENGQIIPPTAEDVHSMAPEIMDALGKSYSNKDDVNWLAGELTGILGPAGDDPSKIRQNIERRYVSMQNTAEVLKQTYGEIVQQQVGGMTVPTEVLPRAGISRPLPGGSAIAHTPTTAEMNDPTTVKTPQGADMTGPRASVMPMVNGAGQVMPGTGKGAGTYTGPTPETVAAQGAGVESANKVAESLNEAVMNWVPLETFMSAEREALTQFKAGGAANWRAAAAKLVGGAKDLGIPISQDTVNKIAGGDLAAMQAFQASAASSATGMMKQAVQGTGRAMIPEVQLFLERYGDITNDPRALEKIYDFTTQMGKKLRNMQGDWAKFNEDKTQGRQSLPYASFPSWASQRAQDRGDITYFTTAERQKAGLPAAAKSTKEAEDNVKASGNTNGFTIRRKPKATP